MLLFMCYQLDNILHSFYKSSFALAICTYRIKLKSNHHIFENLKIKGLSFKKMYDQHKIGRLLSLLN